MKGKRRSQTFMLDRKSSSWFYPKSTGDPGRDRNARTLQFSCFLLAFAVGAVLIVSAIDREWQQTPLLVSAITGLVAAVVMNRAGRSDWAGRTAFLVVLLSAILLVFQAHDGFRSHSMLVFPGLLLISVMMLDRAAYVTTAGLVVLAVAALGIAVKHGLTRATPPVRTTYDSIFYVDLNMLVIAIIGSRIARDTQSNVAHLRVTINRLSTANLELRRTQESLQDSERRLKSAQRLTRVGSWHWNLGVNQVVCSEECKRIFGQPEDYAPSLDGLLQIITPSDRARVANEIQHGIEDRGGCSTEFQIVQPSGGLRTVTFTSQVLLDEEGSPRHIFGACQDITEQRLAEAALRRNLDEMAHLNRVAAMGELTSSLAHELNQPLAAILSNAQAAIRFLGGESPDLAQVRECLIDIVADDKRAGEVIRTLRALLRKGESQASLVDLNEVVTEAIHLLRSDAKLRHTSVKFEPLPAVRLVLGDWTQLYQVVLNLILNSLEATAERPPDNRWVLVRTVESEGGGVELTVEDSGRGITEGDLARVFEPFFTTKQEGLGMGLSISRTIVQAHGGQIWAENRAGRGAIFHCMLPVAQQGAVAATL
jgi:PAS domain S-box-containing protein